MWCGLTVVTKCAERVVTEKSTSVLNDAGYVATWRGVRVRVRVRVRASSQ